VYARLLRLPRQTCMRRRGRAAQNGRPMLRVAHTYLRLLKGLLVALALLMVALVFGNFVLRYAFASGLAVAEELSRWALVWVSFVGATVALAERRHLAMLGVVQALPPRTARAVLLLAQLACLAASMFFLVGAWRQVLLNLGMKAPVTGWPLGLALYGAGLFFAAHAVPIIAWQMLQTLRAGPPRWQQG
jgi:TRAP-type C4-dicarboxylate transport system permease small subunit